MMFFVPRILRLLYPYRIWEIKTDRKEIFLTFDDGPIHNATEWVLDQLKAFNAKATFFCVGENVEKHPDIFSKIISAGHSVGNHTYNHLKGWETSSSDYLVNIEKCNNLVASKLFRPPYGKMKGRQSRLIRKAGYKIVMWTLLSYDFKQRIDLNKVIQKIKKKIEPGSIIVFHDNIKALENLKILLPELLKHLSDKGYIFSAIKL